MNSNFNPRFKPDETVRVLRDQADKDGAVTIPAGRLCKVGLHPFTSDRKVTVRCVLGPDVWLEVPEEDLEYVGRTCFGEAPRAGQRVTGRVERISVQPGCLDTALLVLEGVPGLFRVSVLSRVDEALLGLTQPKDKVEFVVTQDSPLAEANAFKNLSLTVFNTV